MVKYLSAAWFDRLRHTEPVGAPDGPGALVLRHRLRAADNGGPDDVDPGDAGDWDYDVVVSAGRAVIRHPVHGQADLTFTSDYQTAAAIAAGRLSTRAALAEGRLRVGGDVGVLARRAVDVSGLDPMPAGLRAETEF
jgi:hypothetical protein